MSDGWSKGNQNKKWFRCSKTSAIYKVANSYGQKTASQYRMSGEASATLPKPPERTTWEVELYKLLGSDKCVAAAGRAAAPPHPILSIISSSHGLAAGSRPPPGHTGPGTIPRIRRPPSPFPPPRYKVLVEYDHMKYCELRIKNQGKDYNLVHVKMNVEYPSEFSKGKGGGFDGAGLGGFGGTKDGIMKSLSAFSSSNAVKLGKVKYKPKKKFKAPKKLESGHNLFTALGPSRTHTHTHTRAHAHTHTHTRAHTHTSA